MENKIMNGKTLRTAEILAMATPIPCIKMEIGNILLPRWNPENLMSYMFRMCVKTKEAPMGCFYDEAEFTPVLRIVDHAVVDEHNRTDNYCWDKKMVAKHIDRAVPIGTDSAKGIVVMSKLMGSIPKEADRLTLATLFSEQKRDLLYIVTPEEARMCIPVTKELYDAGLTWCIDEWIEPDENGEYMRTELEVGDVLIASENGVYCCRKNVFAKTYKF